VVNYTIPWLPKKSIDFPTVERLLSKSVETNQLTNYGPVTQEFEEYLTKLLEVGDDRELILCNNGTAAMHCIVNTLKIVNGWERFATSDYTFPSNISGPLEGVTVCDVDETLTTPKSYIPANIECFIHTNLFGMVQRHPDEYGDLPLILDNAATPYSILDNKNIVNFGEACIVSLHHTKQIGFGECGVAVVKKKYSEILRSLITFGIPTGHLKYGMNGKPSDIASAYAYQYILNNFDGIKVRNKRIYDYYVSQLGEFIPDIGKDSIPFCYPLFSERADELQALLAENGIETKKYYKPLVGMKKAVEMYDKILCLPCYVVIPSPFQGLGADQDNHT